MFQPLDQHQGAARRFFLISNFKRWIVWSPYEKLDPDMKRTLRRRTHGDHQFNSVPSSLIALELDFEKPFKANDTVDFDACSKHSN